MWQELPAHAGTEEKSMGRCGNHDAIPWQDYLSSGAGGSYSSKIGSHFSQSRRSSGEAAWWAQPQRLTWNQRYSRQCGSFCFLFVVGVRVVRTLDFINDLYTQLFHNRPSLVMLDRRIPGRPGTLRASRQQAATCSCKKSKGKKSPKKWQLNKSKCSRSVIKITSPKKVKLPWQKKFTSNKKVKLPKLGGRRQPVEGLAFFPHACPNFENLAPKYLYQEICHLFPGTN